MRRLILIIPDWLAAPGGESVLRQSLSGLNRLTEIGSIKRLAPIQEVSVIEAAYLGLNPYEVHLAQGPLTVSALGFDPPERSVHFHLSLLSLDTTGKAKVIENAIPPDLSSQVFKILKRLDTSRLTVLEGRDVDHALVWEDGSAEMRCNSPIEANGAPYTSRMPEGDGEALLRRFIDDSINLLTEQEFNLRRIDEGTPPINLAWPWGQGYRFALPNLLLKTGPVHIESPSLRLAGLARLVRYRHGDIREFGLGTAIRLEAILKASKAQACSIVYLPNLADFRALDKLEELDWLTRELDRRFFVPLAEEMATGELQLTLLSPGSESHGLMLTAQSHRHEQNVYPFDERSLEERFISTQDVWQAVSEGIRWAQ